MWEWFSCKPSAYVFRAACPAPWGYPILFSLQECKTVQMDALLGSGKCLTSDSLLGVRARGLFEMLSGLHGAEMDDDGKNSETDLVGGELPVPQNTCV